MQTRLGAVIFVVLLALGGACGPRQFGRSTNTEAPSGQGGFENVSDGGVADDEDQGNVILSSDDDEAWTDVEIGEGEEWSE